MNMMELKNYIAKNEEDMGIELMVNQCEIEMFNEELMYNNVVEDNPIDIVA